MDSVDSVGPAARNAVVHVLRGAGPRPCKKRRRQKRSGPGTYKPGGQQHLSVRPEVCTEIM